MAPAHPPAVFRGAPAGRARRGHIAITVVLWTSAFLVYQTTFIPTPRLFLFPEAGSFDADIPEYAAALRGAPNETDMRKHLLYAPLGRALYRCADRARLFCGMNSDTVALVFPGALYGATSAAIAYFLFLGFMADTRRAAIAAACYAFTYSMWLMSSISESYALTALSVNLFLLFICKKDAGSGWRWGAGVVGLIALSSLCDLRSVFLLILPLYLVARTPSMAWAKRAGYMCAIALGACALIGATYQAYAYFSGRTAFGMDAVCTWMPVYRRAHTSSRWMFDARCIARSLRIIFRDAFSPLSPEQCGRSAALPPWAPMFPAYGFFTIVSVLVLGSLRAVRARIISCPRLQALLCWLVADLLSLFVIFRRTALLHTPPVMLPLMLLIVPAAVAAWAPRRIGIPLLGAATILMLTHNLTVLNDARSAWQMPDIVQSPADRIYILPGEMLRARFLALTMLSRCPPEERDRLTALKGRAARPLSAQEGRELDALTRGALGRLSASERAQLDDIAHRHREAIRLSKGVP
ncbi:MAG: hypothetical protein WCP22_06075 [Chlamydiota bacterium]